MVKVRKESKTTPMLPAWKKSVNYEITCQVQEYRSKFLSGSSDMILRNINYNQIQKVSSQPCSRQTSSKKPRQTLNRETKRSDFHGPIALLPTIKSKKVLPCSFYQIFAIPSKHSSNHYNESIFNYHLPQQSINSTLYSYFIISYV